MKINLEYMLFAGTAAVLQRLPLTFVRKAAWLIARAVFYFVPIRKSLTLQQLRRGFPDLPESGIRSIGVGCYHNLVTTIFEMMWTPRILEEGLHTRLPIRNPEVALNALERGQGVIFMAGHFGNWEWLSLAVGRILNITITSIVHPIHNPAVDDLVEGYRMMYGNRVVPMGISIREIIRILRSKGVVAMIADQSGPSGSIYVPYFGTYAATYEGPALFSLKTGAPIIMGFPVRQASGDYEIIFEEIPSDDLEGASRENLNELTRRHVKALERMVRKYPDLWLWQHKRWKHHPGPDSIVLVENDALISGDRSDAAEDLSDSPKDRSDSLDASASEPRAL